MKTGEHENSNEKIINEEIKNEKEVEDNINEKIINEKLINKRVIGDLLKDNTKRIKNNKIAIDLEEMNIPSKSFTKVTLNYNLEEVIGEGTFGKVYRANKSSKLYGIKKLNRNEDGLHITTIREIRYLRKVNHKNIVELLEINIDNSEIFLIFPYYRFDLYTYLKKNIPNKREIIHLVKQISEGLKYLKSLNILHRDIKSSNILLDFNLNVKLADFGMATTTNKNSSYSPGVVTLWYRPPEILLNMSYEFPCDIWGLGCILGELLQGRALFVGNTEILVLECIVLVCGSINSKSLPNMKNHDIKIPQSTRNLRKIFKNSDEDLVDLLDRILVINPMERLTVEEILQDKIFYNYDGELINEISKRFENQSN